MLRPPGGFDQAGLPHPILYQGRSVAKRDVRTASLSPDCDECRAIGEAWRRGLCACRADFLLRHESCIDQDGSEEVELSIETIATDTHPRFTIDVDKAGFVEGSTQLATHGGIAAARSHEFTYCAPEPFERGSRWFREPAGDPIRLFETEPSAGTDRLDHAPDCLTPQCKVAQDAAGVNEIEGRRFECLLSDVMAPNLNIASAHRLEPTRLEIGCHDSSGRPNAVGQPNRDGTDTRPDLSAVPASGDPERIQEPTCRRVHGRSDAFQSVTHGRVNW